MGMFPSQSTNDVTTRQLETSGPRGWGGLLTSPMRLPAVEAMLMALGFLEWPPLRMGDALDLVRVCLTIPSAILFVCVAPASVSPSGSLSRVAASCDSCRSCDPWLDSSSWALAALMPPSLAGGVNIRSDWWVELVSWELLPDEST